MRRKVRAGPPGVVAPGVVALGEAGNSDSTLARQRLLFAFLCFVWGTTWIAMKVGVAEVPPAFFAGTRWVVAGICLVGWRWARGERIRVPRRLWPRLVLVTVLMICLNGVIQLYGLRFVPAGLATVISSALTPIALTGFSVLAGQDRFTPRQIAALALGVGGILLAFGPEALAGKLGWPEALGAAGVIAGTLSYSYGSVLARPLMRILAPGELAALTNCLGGFLLLGGSLAVEPGSWAALRGAWGWSAFAAWLYLLIPSSLGATLIYFLLVRDWGVSRTGSYAFIAPVIGVVAAMLLLGEQVGVAEVFGMAVMLGAAALVLKR
ncbi:MAG: DMT family transporter [Acetobacteraceae bacterium]